jgi:organic radical activating enzyme
MNNLINFRQNYLYQFNLYINTICNQKCPYCYARKLLDWNKIVPVQVIKKTLKNLSILNNIFISLIGGEPFLHPRIQEIINYLDELNLVYHSYTNGSINLEKFNLKNIKLTLSLHYVLKDYDVFLKNIKFLEKNNFDYNLTFVFFNDKKHIQFFDKVFNEIKDKNRIYISFIHDHFKNDEFQKYKNDYLNFINKYNFTNIYDLKEANTKKCFYNEIDLKYVKNKYYFYLNDCIKNFLSEINNTKMLECNKKNVLKLKNKKKFFICNQKCPLDPAFYDSWVEIKE